MNQFPKSVRRHHYHYKGNQNYLYTHILAQVFLVNKLRKQSEHRKEACNYVNNGNLKLETEINIADHKIKSSITALEIIKSANIELKKEFLLAKERKIKIFERIKLGIAKYENLWTISKTRYDNMPFIKNFLQVKNQSLTLREHINTLNDESQRLALDITRKQAELAELDKLHVIKISDYLIRQRPKTLQMLKEKNNKINDLNKNIQGLIKQYNVDNSITPEKPVTEKSQVEFKNKELVKSCVDLNTNDILVLPKLQLCNIDFDFPTNKLDQIKIEKFSNPIAMNNTTVTHNDSSKNIKLNLMEIDTQNNKFIVENTNYSKNKLINILDDIKLDKTQTYELVSKIKLSDLQETKLIHEIKTELFKQESVKNKVDDDVLETLELECVEEIGMTTKHSPVLVPPSQFLDTDSNSDNQVQQQFTTIDNSKENLQNMEDGTGVISGKMDEKSVTSDENFNTMKESILKKNNLNTSPQFTYSKKQIINLGRSVPQDWCAYISHIEKCFQTSEGSTSKFFHGDNSDHVIENKCKDIQKNIIDNSRSISRNIFEAAAEKDNLCPNTCLGSKAKENFLASYTEVPVAGYLFRNGPEGIAESLDVSLNTTGYDDGDMDFPHCIDSSLLLSPKADLSETNEKNFEVTSQEVPNFLSGIKKTGLSFFGCMSNKSENQPETSTKASDFNFNFECDEKKSRGGLFSMFQ